MSQHYQFDVIIIGGGIAGLSLALRLAPTAKVAILSKHALFTSASQSAQGGIAASTDDHDIAHHITDTINAGAGLCDPAVVESTIQQSSAAIQWLIKHGVPFSRDSNDPKHYHLTREGGHSCRRVYHVADSTGAAIMQTLSQQVQQHPQITCLTHYTAIDLLVKDQHCFGSLVIDPDNIPQRLFAKTTILATGGASTVYQHTSNPKPSSGDGIAMAWRAGCRLANLEFTQFHPTCFHHPQHSSFLISEALRGEGGHLTLANGQRFMPSYDKRAELAPRDIVARAITREMQQCSLDHVLLNISHLTKDKIQQLFPMIHQRCLDAGIDISTQAIPVVPAAHYTCGGVITNQSGQTDIQHLYAIGEVAYTGLHGANRLASNSLLECVVFAKNSFDAIKTQQRTTAPTIPHHFRLPDYQPLTPDLNALKYINQQLKTMMSNQLGILRSNHSIQQAHQYITQLKAQFHQAAPQASTHPGYLAVNNRLQVAKLMIESAATRQESRGAHYNSDYPNTLKTTIPTIIENPITAPTF